MSILLIGDIHGKVNQYKEIIKDEPYTLQLGDFGFRREYAALSDIDASCHRIIAGNHDDYGKVDGLSVQPTHFLGDFGETSLNELSFFFVRGAHSIDWERRIEGVSYWKDEELNREQMNRCFALYKRVKPAVVFAHDCPLKVFRALEAHKCKRNGWNSRDFGVSRTTQLLSALFEEHQPKLWVFGHHHWNWSGGVSGNRTTFVCLGELNTLRVY